MALSDSLARADDGFLGERRLGHLRDLDLPRQPEPAQRADPNPVQVEFVPGEAVASRDGMRVMVVVPALAEGDERNPPVVGRVVTRLEAARRTYMRRRVHQPGAVQDERRSEEDAPQHVRNAAEGQQTDADDHIGYPVPG